MPGGLDHLYRFHANNGTASGPQWSVSGSSLEGTTRFYRVYYDDDDGTPYAAEAVLKPSATGGDEEAERFLLAVQGWLHTRGSGLNDVFLSALYQLFHEDPWLQTAIHVIVAIEPVD
jgi:hypothetical protein